MKPEKIISTADNFIEPGGLTYSGIDYRDVSLHGHDLVDLEKMLTLAVENMPEIGYDLEFSYPICANINKRYNFRTSSVEISEFVKKAVESLYNPERSS